MWRSDARIDSDDAADPWRLGTILAIVSVVCALLLPLFPPFTSIAAIVIGHIARIRMREFTGSRAAAVISVIGLTFGYAGLLLILTLPEDGLRLWGSSELARRASCQYNLKQIKYACMTYSANHDGILPERFNDLYPELISEPAAFLCPSSTVSMGDTNAIESWTSYEFVSKAPGEKADHFVTVREKDRHAHKLGRNYLYSDGRIAFMRERD